ncbi:hypothetical protein NM688_g4240 [Phlebia brevispora]|uniref:Uncharacterized protein n=1 Tax=Phlebia brevispora TaxID=194682 RepID=A0ACC1T3Q0_9APHY|nr:hypothetical protein NM688_g4240 [Phlebia brevispora]
MRGICYYECHQAFPLSCERVLVSQGEKLMAALSIFIWTFFMRHSSLGAAQRPRSTFLSFRSRDSFPQVFALTAQFASNRLAHYTTMKFATILSFVATIATLTAAQDSSLAAVKAAFNNAHIPQDLNINFNPNTLFEVTFPQQHGQNITVTVGQLLPRGDTVGPPTFAVQGNVNANDRFVIAAVDPDAPTPQHPTNAQIRNFLGADFARGADLGKGLEALVSRTAPVSPWRQPNPPHGSDPHRIVFLLFAEPHNFDQQKLVTPSTPRAHFNISSFAKATGLGDPLGGTFIRVGPDACKKGFILIYTDTKIAYPVSCLTSRASITDGSREASQDRDAFSQPALSRKHDPRVRTQINECSGRKGIFKLRPRPHDDARNASDCIARLSKMKLAILLPLLGTLLVSTAAQDRSVDDVKAAFASAQIPEDLHITFDPTVLLEVTLPQLNGQEVPVTAGVQLPRNATVGPPHIAVRGNINAKRRQRFVVATVDPDVPTPQDPTEAQIRHFLAPNFIRSAGSSLGEVSLVNLTAPLSNWLQPTPPAGSPAHRYVFLLFEQPRGFNRQQLVNASTPVTNFNISAFAEAVGLGNPIAGTFMRVAPDPSS